MRNQFHGSSVAIVLGLLAALVGIAAVGRGESAIDHGLNLGITMVLSALAYRSAKRRLLRLAPASPARVTLEILAMLLVIYGVIGMNEPELKRALVGNPITIFVAPLWGLITYGCVAFWPRLPSTAISGASGEQALCIEAAIYERIDRELHGGTLDRALWTRVFAEVDGDEGRAKARYIKARAERLAQYARSHVAGGAESTDGGASGVHVG